MWYYRTHTGKTYDTKSIKILSAENTHQHSVSGVFNTTETKYRNLLHRPVPETKLKASCKVRLKKAKMVL